MADDRRPPLGVTVEYLKLLREKWWLLVATLVFSGGYDVVKWVAGEFGHAIDFPRWVPLLLGGITLFVAQFLAFAQMRNQRNEALSRVFAKRPRVVLKFAPRHIKPTGPLETNEIGLIAFTNFVQYAEGFSFVNVGDAPAFNVGAIMEIRPSNYRITIGPTPIVPDSKPVGAAATLSIGARTVPLQIRIAKFLQQGLAEQGHAQSEKAQIEFEVTYVDFERSLRFATPHMLIIPSGDGEITIRLSNRAEPNPSLSLSADESAVHA